MFTSVYRSTVTCFHTTSHLPAFIHIFENAVCHNVALGPQALPDILKNLEEREGRRGSVSRESPVLFSIFGSFESLPYLSLWESLA